MEGGNNEIIKHTIRALGHNEVCVDYINKENYLPRHLPSKWKELFRIFYLRRIATDTRFSQFDLIVSLQPNSHCIRHKNHVVYFQHHIKPYYDDFWYFLTKKKGVRKKAIFLLLMGLTRVGDWLYLRPNLKRSTVVANSLTTARRLKRYSRISQLSIINPGTSLISLEEQSEVNCSKITDELRNLFKSQIVLLSFSRLNIIQKGIDILLDVALLMQTYQFIIAGPFDATIESKELQRIPTNVKVIIKNFSDNEKSYLFRNCDVFLAPYISEDFGIAPLEANSCGKPVLYCEDSGEIVNTQKHTITGFKCKRTPREIAIGIEYCIKNKERMRLACIENASQYSWTNFEVSFRSAIFRKSYDKC